MNYRGPLKTIVLLLLPCLLVGGLRLWALSRQTPHLEEIASEIGSIPQFRVGLHPNYAGSALIYFQETETGLGTFCCETTSGKTRLLYEEKEKGYRNRFRLLGWAPDDSLVGFTIISDGETTNSSRVITLCNGLTGEVISTIPAGGIAGDAQFIWFSPDSFVYSTYTHRAWLRYARKPDGKWVQTQVVKRFVDGRLANVTPISSHAIAWQSKGTVWTYDFDSGAMEQVWKSTTNQLTSMTYSKESGNLMLRCKDNEGGFVIEFHQPRDGNTNAFIVRASRPPPIPPRLDIVMQDGHFVLTQHPDGGTNQTTFVWDGMMHFFDGSLHYYAQCGDDFYFIGSQVDGIPGIWHHNFKSRETRLVISSLHGRLKWAKLTEPTVGVYTNQNGKQVSYHLWPPADRVPGRQYPIVLAKDLHIWNPFQQATASSGCFYAHLDLTDWDFSTWPEDVAGLYQVVSHNAEIDTNRVFILASSGQNARVPGIVGQKISNPKGFILYHPAGLDQLTSVPATRILMLSGNQDRDASVADLNKLQGDAINQGDYISLLIQDGVQHLTRSVASEREETVRFARFLNQNK